MADESAGTSFTVNGKAYCLPTDLTMGEMCDAERYFGVEFGNNTSSGARMAAALIYIAVRREDPTVTPEDIRELPTEVFESFGADASPPAEEPGSVSESSGHSSSNGSETPDNLRPPIGDRGSDTGSASDLAISRS